MDFTERLQAGIEALRRHEVAAAEAELSACLSEQPDHPEALLYLGVAKGLQGNDAAAEELILRAREQAPDEPRVLFNLARLKHRAGDLRAASALYHEVLRRDPDHAQAREWIAQLREPDEKPLPARNLAPRDDQLIRCVRPGSVAKVGALFGLGAGMLSLVTMPIQYGLMGQEMSYPYYGGMFIGEVLAFPLIALLAAWLYNLCAGWFGPVAVTIDEHDDGFQLSRVDTVSLARMSTAIFVPIVMLICLIAVPVVMFATMGASGAGGGPMVAGLLIGMVVMLVVGSLVGSAAQFLYALLVGATYNWAVGFTGGLQFSQRRDGEWWEVHRLRFLPTWLSFLVCSLWSIFLTMGLLALSLSLSGETQALTVNLIISPLATLIQGAVLIWMYNLAGQWFGGLQLEFEEN